ncbi:MAG: hypothetical protein WAL99_20560, partial [Pseudonocardiaceae bacterium]
MPVLCFVEIEIVGPGQGMPCTVCLLHRVSVAKVGRAATRGQAPTAEVLLAAAERADGCAVDGADGRGVSGPRRWGAGRGLVVGVAGWSSG